MEGERESERDRNQGNNDEGESGNEEYFLFSIMIIFKSIDFAWSLC
jgi:hypothetical protein